MPLAFTIVYLSARRLPALPILSRLNRDPEAGLAARPEAGPRRGEGSRPEEERRRRTVLDPPRDRKRGSARGRRPEAGGQYGCSPLRVSVGGCARALARPSLRGIRMNGKNHP
ncbi:hypothetical protein KM043_000041 [Ampulex compressa]|nr:hypothetical protein KM043_000041 [Ampulex compressa]